MTTTKGTNMNKQITLIRMTWEEIEHAAANGGRCIVKYGNTEADTEAATIIRFEWNIAAMKQKVLVRFDDAVEIDYFMCDIYRIEAGA